MPEWIVAIAVPLLAGTTFIAYRHPEAYAKLLLGIFVVWMAIEACIISWDAAAYFQYEHLRPLILAALAQKVSDSSDDIMVGPFPMLIIGAVWIYLSFLSFLPILLGEKEHKNEK